MEEKYIDPDVLVFKDIPVSQNEADTYLAVGDSELNFIYTGYRAAANRIISHMRDVKEIQSAAFDVAAIELSMAELSEVLYNFKRVANIRAYAENMEYPAE